MEGGNRYPIRRRRLARTLAAAGLSDNSCGSGGPGVGVASDDINPGYRMWANGLSAHVPITTLWIMSEDARAMTGLLPGRP